MATTSTRTRPDVPVPNDVDRPVRRPGQDVKLPQRGLGHVAALDGLRGLAFLTVLSYHIDSAGLPMAGYVGVDLFFGLSGFLITVLLVDERRRTGSVSLKRFFARRALRLLPALMLFLVVYLVMTVLFGHQPWFGGIPGGPTPAAPLPVVDALHEAFSAITYTMNLAIAYNWRWGIGAPIGHLWTLGVEGQFYLVWGPLLTAILVVGGSRIRAGRSLSWNLSTFRRPMGTGTSVTRHIRVERRLEQRLLDRHLWQAMVVAVVLAVLSVICTGLAWHGGKGASFVYFATWTRAQGLLLGAAAGLWWALGGPQRLVGSRAGRAATTALAAVAGGWLVLGIWDAPQAGRAGPVVGGLAGFSVCCAAMVMLVAARPWTWLAKLCSMSWLRYVGRRSYALYLWHYPLLAWFRADGALGTVVAVALAFAAAEASWRMVERPALRLRRQDHPTLRLRRQGQQRRHDQLRRQDQIRLPSTWWRHSQVGFGGSTDQNCHG